IGETILTHLFYITINYVGNLDGDVIFEEL
ncbi:MAG: hypothetical protein CFH06_01934, partial [Alphaproteobacteria bacterium MarineAlpha3_Bin5]